MDDDLDQALSAVGPGLRAQVNPGIAGRRRVDEFVEGDTVGPGEGKQQLQGGLAVAGLEPGQGAHRDAGLRRQVAESDLMPLPQRAEPAAYRRERLIYIIVHSFSLPSRQT